MVIQADTTESPVVCETSRAPSREVDPLTKDSNRTRATRSVQNDCFTCVGSHKATEEKLAFHVLRGSMPGPKVANKDPDKAS